MPASRRHTSRQTSRGTRNIFRAAIASQRWNAMFQPVEASHNRLLAGFQGIAATVM